MLELLLAFGLGAMVLWFVVPFVYSQVKHNKEMRRLKEITDLLDEANALPNGPEYNDRRRALLTEAVRRQGFPI